MRALIVILAAFAVGCGDAGRTARIQTQQKLIQELQAKLSKAEALDLDEKCAKQALAEFEAIKKVSFPRSFASFSNHYNTELGKCFLFVSSEETYVSGPLKGRIATTVILNDAYEGKRYAGYHLLSDPTREVKPVECHVFMPSGEKKICESADEFDELVKTYMGRGGQ